MGGHEIDRFGRDLLRRYHQIAFILTIGIVGHNDHASFGDVAQHIVNRVKLKCFCRLRDHRNNTITSGARWGNSYSCS